MGSKRLGWPAKGATGWRSAENWRIRRQLKAKRGCEQQQGSKLKNSRGPCRGVCGCLGTNVGGSLGSGWKFRGKEQPVGQEKGQSGFNPGEIPTPSPPVSVACNPTTLHSPLPSLGGRSSQCFRPLLPRFCTFVSPIRGARCARCTAGLRVHGPSH
jgi:hypothetical protein